MTNLKEPIYVHGSGVPWQLRYRSAIAKGLTRRGLDVHEHGLTNAYQGTHIVLGPNSWRHVEQLCKARGDDYITINRAFFGSVLGDEENPYVAIGWNGFNRNARFPFSYDDIGHGKHPHSRLTDDLKADILPMVADSGPMMDGDQLKPVLILGEYDTPKAWLTKVSAELAATEFPWKFRPHPNAGDMGLGDHLHPAKTLEDALDQSSYVLSHHSTAGVTALLRGRHTLTYSEESMAWDVTPHKLAGNIGFPPRGVWTEWLAWCQWTIEEIENGDPWEYF